MNNKEKELEAAQAALRLWFKAYDTNDYEGMEDARTATVRALCMSRSLGIGEVRWTTNLKVPDNERG